MYSNPRRAGFDPRYGPGFDPRFAGAPNGPYGPYGPVDAAVPDVPNLSRPIVGVQPWGVFVSVVLGLLSFGILPILLWPGRFRRFVRIERQRLGHIVHWAQLSTVHGDASRLAVTLFRVRY